MNTMFKSTSIFTGNQKSGRRNPSFFAILLTLSFALLTSCGADKPVDGADKLRTDISSYQQQINEMTLKISELEQQLEAMGERPVSKARIAVEIMDLQPQQFDQYFSVNGSVEAAQEAAISPEINGQIKQILVSKGQRVNAGQTIARLTTSIIESNMEEVKTSLQLAKTVYERQKGLWEQEIGSEMQYLEAKNAYESLQTRMKTLESQLDLATIRAPLSGIVDDIFVKAGELAMPGMPLMKIINLNLLYINADVAESLLPAIDLSKKIILRIPTFPDYQELVAVHRLGHVINPENRTFRLQLQIANPGEKLKPNMTAALSIQKSSVQDAIVVPSILIKQDVQGYFVFIAVKNDKGEMIAKKTYIIRGNDGEGQTMISSGLSAGDQIIYRGHNLVSDGALVWFD